MKSYLNKLGVWLVLRTQKDRIIDPVEKAVFDAFCEVGLNKEFYSHDFNLVQANKLTDVYHLAARKAGIQPELSTVGEVIKWLKS